MGEKLKATVSMKENERHKIIPKETATISHGTKGLQKTDPEIHPALYLSHKYPFFLSSACAQT